MQTNRPPCFFGELINVVPHCSSIRCFVTFRSTHFRQWLWQRTVRTTITGEMDTLKREIYFCPCDWGEVVFFWQFSEVRKWRISSTAFSTPINGDSFIGWLCLFCIQALMVIVYFSVYIPTAFFFLAIGLNFRACAQHFRTMFTSMHEMSAGNRTNKCQWRLHRKRSLVEVIHFHNRVKRWARIMWHYFQNYPINLTNSFQHLCRVAWSNEWHHFLSIDHGHHFHVAVQFRIWVGTTSHSRITIYFIQFGRQ